MQLPQGVRTVMRVGFDATDPIGRALYRATTGYKGALPPADMRNRTGGRFVHRFMAGGRNCAAALGDALASVSPMSIYDFEAVLDFGCGCGRTILQWDPARSNNIVGCDVDRACVEWLSEALPERTFLVNSFDPPLPFDDAHFDLVYAVSIFSHLDAGDQQRWLTEIARVVRPGGLALITVQGHHAVRQFSAGPLRDRLARHDLEAEGFVYLPYQDVEPGGRLLPGIRSDVREVSYGLTFMSPEHLASRWVGDPFELIGLAEGTVDDLQDVAILKRTPPE